MDKPVFVLDRGKWRPYLWDRDLLSVTSLGDVIPALDSDEAEDLAIAHVHRGAEISVDVIAVVPPTESDLINLEHFLATRARSAGAVSRPVWEEID